MRTKYEIARHGGTRALRVGNLAWEKTRDRHRAAVMKAWADKHGYAYTPGCEVPASFRNQGHGLHHVTGSINGHHTSIFDIKTDAVHGRKSRLTAVVVLTIDGQWPPHPAAPAELHDRPYHWRVENNQVIAWWRGTVAPIDMWLAANTIAVNLGLSGTLQLELGAAHAAA